MGGAVGNAGLMHPQTYLGHQQSYNGYPGAAYGIPERSFGMYQQGPWPGGGAEPVLSVGTPGSPSAMAGQVPGVRLLLEPPPMLDKLDPRAMVLVLKGGPWPGRRTQTFRSSRSGTATQIGQEWCEILRQACGHGDMDPTERQPSA